MISVFLYSLIFLFSILIYVLINYSLGILGYRTFGISNDDNSGDENSSERLSYEAYILAIFIRNFIICLGVGSFILLVINDKSIFSFSNKFNIIIASILYFIILVLTIIITNKIFSLLNSKLYFIAQLMGNILEFTASIPGIKKLVRYAGVPTSDQANDDEKATATLIETLDLLESEQIPAHQEDLRMIRGILRMDDLRVSEIMKPRPDIVATSINESIDTIIEKMTVGGYSKIPVYNSDLDSIEGVLFARDILKVDNKNFNKNTLKKLLRQPLYLPESQNLETLLNQFQTHSTSIGIVLDEHGSVSGLVTVTDLVEEIIGELADEFDTEPPEIQEIRQDSFLIDATVSLDQINRKFNLKFDSEGISTIGGFIYSQLGKIPIVGDIVETSDCVITVRTIQGRRIKRVSISLK
ncbi:MAG: hemolysin family protein [Chloroflexota bacterium]|jgi:CBS domain containing-hemolysin-like protein|nr:hemolysin family protein [Chloroflexota bacterium]|tara:strand:- start:8684 stop:9919 length:1236 start_codon:yes stop_codon:yes gene_type:complete